MALTARDIFEAAPNITVKPVDPAKRGKTLVRVRLGRSGSPSMSPAKPKPDAGARGANPSNGR